MPQTVNKDETSRPRPGVKAEEFKHEMITFYSLLGVKENASPEDLKVAYRQLALQQHPDKGGDAGRFHELQMAYDVLEAKDKREAYDDELFKARSRAELVEGAESHPKKPTNVPAREKTAPCPGSKRSKKVEAAAGSNEWKIHGSGRGIMSMIEDGSTVEAKAEVLFSKYKELPRNKDKKRDWLSGVRGEEKAALKAAAKAHEEKQKAKWDKWLGGVQAPKARAKA